MPRTAAAGDDKGIASDDNTAQRTRKKRKVSGNSVPEGELERMRQELATVQLALSAEKASAAAAAKEATLSLGRSMVSPLQKYHRYSVYRVEELPEGHPVYQLLAHQFMRSSDTHVRKTKARQEIGVGPLHGDRPLFEITKINRIHNPRLQQKYVAEVEDIAGLCKKKVIDQLPEVDALRVESLHGLNLNEFLLFRGDKSDITPHLQQQGFDPRLAGTGTAKMFGMGTYFACKSSKSDIYTKPLADGERCTLVVRTCLGEPYKAARGDPAMTAPPARTDGNMGRLNSVVGLTQAAGGRLQHPEYIVYKEAQALPEYAVWYRHAVQCACTHCAHVKVSLAGTVYRVEASRHDTLATVTKLLRHVGALDSSITEVCYHKVDDALAPSPVAVGPALEVLPSEGPLVLACVTKSASYTLAREENIKKYVPDYLPFAVAGHQESHPCRLTADPGATTTILICRCLLRSIRNEEFLKFSFEALIKSWQNSRK